MQKYKIRNGWLSCDSAKQDLGLVKHKRHTNQQYNIVEKELIAYYDDLTGLL